MDSLVPLVDPFLGSESPGNCLPGPYLPFGLVRLGPDVVPPHPTHGYSRSGPIARFTHTHVSGTGGLGRYGNIGLMPFDPRTAHHAVPQDQQEEVAGAGWYRVRLAPCGVLVELTAAHACGATRFTREDGPLGVTLDATTFIDTGWAGPEIDPNGFPPRVLGGRVRVQGPASLSGFVTVAGGWGHDAPYSVYFAAEFDSPWRSLAWRTGPEPTESPMRADLVFDAGRTTVRVGISYASEDQARHNLLDETDGHTFDALRTRAEAAWERALAGVRVAGGSDAERTLFATSLYRLFCMPSDLGVGKEFEGWPSFRRHFSDFYCLWDSCRNANGLLAWLEPQRHADMVNCLLEVSERKGWSPDAWIAGASAFLQGGSSLDVLLAEAATRRLPGIDLRWAWEVVEAQAQTPSPDPYLYGRHPEDRMHPYLPMGVPQCVSRTLEYRFQDACLARLAAALDRGGEARRRAARAADVWQLWRDDVRSFAPRHADGAWVEPFDPDVCRWDSWNDPYCYEGSCRQWSWNVLHDVPGLVRRMGGPDGFAAMLGEFLKEVHPPGPETEGPGTEGPETEGPKTEGMVEAARYHPKETMLHAPYLFSEVGRPDLASRHVRRILARFYRPEREGLPDNEDMGCQSGFVISACLGLYPVMGEDRWWITAPVFEETEVRPAGAARGFRVLAPGAGPDRTSVRSAKLNGAVLDRPWIRQEEMDGGVLELDLGP